MLKLLRIVLVLLIHLKPHQNQQPPGKAPSSHGVLASEMIEGQVLDFDDLQMQRGYQGMAAYGRSKLANLYFTYELARRLFGTDVTVNVLHPGFVATHLGADNLPLIGGLIKRVINLAAMNVEKGAQTSIYPASSPEVDKTTGKYLVDCRPVSSSPVPYDETAARRLWQISDELTDLAA